MTDLTTLTNKVRSALEALVGHGATSSDIRLALSDAREMERLALAEIETAKGEHAEAIRTFDRDRGLAALAREQSAAFDLGAAREAIASFEVEEATAIAVEEQARRQEAYDAASTVLSTAEEALIVEYPALAHRIREIVRLRAEADARVDEINAKLPAGVEPLQSLSARYFTWRGLPEQVLEVIERDLWVSTHSGRVIPDEMQAKYQDDGTGHGVKFSGMDRSRAVLRRVRRTKYLPAVTRQIYDGFSNVLMLPGITGEPAYFTPAFSDAPAAVFSRLAELEALEASVRPRTRTPQFRDEVLPMSEPEAA